MREFINKDQYRELKKKYKDDKDCCYIKLNGKKLKTKEEYYEKLKEKLQLNDSFSNNINAYSDMMRDPYTYYNKDIILFVIKNYDKFLCEEASRSSYNQIFDKDIIPVLRSEDKYVHVYCVN